MDKICLCIADLAPHIKGMDSLLAEKCIADVNAFANIKSISAKYDIEIAENIKLKNSNLVFTGKSILEHLIGCSSVVIFCATLGAAIDELIEKKGVVSVLDGYAVDVAASVLIEKACENLERNIMLQAAESGFKATTRFSCGYGDLPIECQGEFIKALQTDKRIGVSVTDSNILIPRKSVTAIIGLGKDIKYKSGRCNSCKKREDCKGGLCAD